MKTEVINLCERVIKYMAKIPGITEQSIMNQASRIRTDLKVKKKK